MESPEIRSRMAHSLRHYFLRVGTRFGRGASTVVKVLAAADVRNNRSQRVMERLGVMREGVLRSHITQRGERIDGVYYGILRQEWERSRELSTS